LCTSLMMFVVAVFVLLMMHGSAKAADPPIPQGTLPSAGDFTQGSQVSLITAIYGNGYVLDSPTSTIRLYSPTRTGITLNIINGANCPGQGGDVGPSNSETTTTYFFYQVSPDNLNGYDNTPYGSTLTQVHAPITNHDIGCNNAVFPVTFNGNQNISAVGAGPASGQFAFQIVAIMNDTGGPGWNQFKYQVSAGNGRLSYYAGAGDHFAIKAVDGATPDPGNYKLGFAPGCGLKDGQSESATLRWFDEDAGQSNQGNDPYVKTEIVEFDANNNPTGYTVPLGTLSGASNGGRDGDSGPDGSGDRLINITSGNNVGGSAQITIRGHHKYEWVQYNIYDGNGLQFQLPKDSYNTLINYNTDCPQPYTAKCSVTASSTNPNIGDTVTVNVTMTNTGDSGWVVGQQLMKRTGPSIKSFALPRNVAPGGSDSVTMTDSIPITSTTVSNYYTYRMYTDSTTQMSQTPVPCRVYIQPQGQPPIGGTPSITANCSETTVTVPKSSITAKWLPPAGTHTGIATLITHIPAQIIITETGTSNSSTYTVPSGKLDVTTTDAVYKTSTFGLWGGMWPHKNYTFQLVIQGVVAGTSSTYNNDYSWGAPWYPTSSYDASQAVGDCLHLACGTTSTADVEPGQTTNLSAGINYTNDTQQSYSTNPTGGYYFHVNTSGGIFNAPGDTSGDPIGPGSGTSNASFSARVDYSGSYSITFMFQGNPLDLGQGNPCPPQTITPATKPFLQVWGGDINTGGGFEQLDTSTGAFSCSNSYPGYVSPSTGGGDVNYGGIKTFGYTDATGTFGSLSDFGALSLGQIASDTSAKVGFNASPKFANTVSPGGVLNSSPPDYCVEDFYDKTQKTPSPLPISPPAQLSSLSGSSTDQYIVSQDVGSFGGGVVPSGRKITLYITGDITITGNITYANWDPTNTDSAPSFTLIVKGNINISPNVTRIDGLYIAQPSSPGQDGSFNTCADNATNQFCNQQFVANGAVIARVIMPLRSVGTVSQDANPAFSPAPGHVPAEIFNYIPSMIVSAPNFSPAYNPLQGLFNLPPVF
jgi:hypothetical protein